MIINYSVNFIAKEKVTSLENDEYNSVAVAKQDVNYTKKKSILSDFLNSKLGDKVSVIESVT